MFAETAQQWRQNGHARGPGTGAGSGVPEGRARGPERLSVVEEESLVEGWPGTILHRATLSAVPQPEDRNYPFAVISASSYNRQTTLKQGKHGQ